MPTPTLKTSNGGVSGAGAGVDIYGGPVVDPTKNVLDTVKNESRYQDGMREQESKFQNAMRDAEARLSHELSKAESQRVNDLEAQRVRYEARIAEDLRVNVKTTSDQLAGQLIKETGALSNQIATLTTSVANQVTTLTTSLTNQMSSQTAGINTRLADLERFRWETGGKSAVADPALSSALVEMSKSISALKEVSTRTVGREEEKTHVIDKTEKINTLTVAVIASIIGGLGVITAVFAIFHH